jgi:hypothetical protein
VQRLLGQIEVAEEANERGQDAARVGSINRLDLGANPIGRVLRETCVVVLD